MKTGPTLPIRSLILFLFYFIFALPGVFLMDLGSGFYTKLF